MSKTILKSNELFEKIKKHPQWRVVEGLPEDKDKCHPLAFDYNETGLRFHWDGATTQYHKKATCAEILDAVGVDIDEEGFKDDVLVAGFDSNWDEARKCYKVTLDDDAKWIKIFTIEESAVKA